MPTHSTVAEIKEDWNKMIADGTLSLGEPCHPHIVVRYITSGGATQSTGIWL